VIMPVTGARWWGRGCCLTAAHLLLWAVLVLEVVAQQKSDHYKLLGVKREATDREIKKAYYKLAIKHHPDKSPECRKSQESSQCKRANRVFMKIAKAYETLSDPEKRRYYDQVLRVCFSNLICRFASAFGVMIIMINKRMFSADRLRRSLSRSAAREPATPGRRQSPWWWQPLWRWRRSIWRRWRTSPSSAQGSSRRSKPGEFQIVATKCSGSEEARAATLCTCRSFAHRTAGQNQKKRRR